MNNGNDLLRQFDMGYEGFAQANAETLDALSKAMSAGSGVDAAVMTGGRALTPESLDTTLVNILHTTDEARLFQRLKKTPVKSVVHQWDVRTEVGADDGAWIPEGGNSQSADQTISRKFTTAKYLQTLRTVTLQASVSNMIEDAIALEKNAGALWIIRNVEKTLFAGNSTLFSVQPDGLKAQIDPGNIIDVRGADATSSTFEDAITSCARTIRNHFGVPTHMFSSTMIMMDVQKLLRDRIRFGNGNVGYGSAVFKTYPTPFGEIELVDDVFITEGDVPSQSSLTTQAPTTPTVNSSTVNGAGQTGSQFGAGDAGNYDYVVVGSNQYGDSAATADIPVTNVLATGSVTINLTGGAILPSAYKVYRSELGGVSGATCLYAFSVAYTGAGQNVIDLNAYLPGTSDVYILNLNPTYDAIEWVQFLPMMKFDLYPTNAAVYPFLMLLFGSLAVKKPVQHARITNVAPASLGWF